MLKPIDLNLLQEVFEVFIDNAISISIEKISAGLINESYKVSCLQNEKNQTYLLQSVNHSIFKSPEDINQNIQVVSEHLTEKTYPRKILRIVKGKTSDGLVKRNGKYWRLLNFISDTYTVDKIEGTEGAYAAAFVFGEYLHYLSDLDPSQVKTTLPDFHDPVMRFSNFKKVLERNPEGKVEQITEIIKGYEAFEFLLEYELSKLPLQVTHNDLKISNLLFSSKDGEAVAIIDLDTLMPGYLIFDFGDMVRSFTNEAEDYDRYDLVRMDMNIFESVALGFFKGMGNEVNSSMTDAFVYGCLLITFEQGLRFLTDYLSGDPYYRIDFADHNLVRAKNQLALLEDMFKKSDEMRLYLQKIM